MSAPRVIRHLHLGHITPFARATAIQDNLVRQHLDYKALTPTSSESTPLLSPPTPLPSPPTPIILTFSSTPVYTTGRRELGTLSPATISLLREPLPEIQIKGLEQGVANGFSPEVKETLRGGQITFHGPGQLVIYPILDLRAMKSAKWPKGLTAKCFVNVLEQATINILKPFGIQGIRTDNPGVWVSEEKKIAALGLHLRRNIASFGVGLNVGTDLRYFDKIVACGLEGKKTTSIKQVLREKYGTNFEGYLSQSKNTDQPPSDRAMVQTMIQMTEMDRLSRAWAKEFLTLIWGNEVKLQQATMDGDSIESQTMKLGEQDNTA